MLKVKRRDRAGFDDALMSTILGSDAFATPSEDRFDPVSSASDRQSGSVGAIEDRVVLTDRGADFVRTTVLHRQSFES